MSNDGLIKNIVGAVVGIKVLETGMKIIDKQKTKVKGGLLYDTKKKKTKKI